ncbi:cell wall-active antibiotics response protein [Undibacterium sp. Jales W-56]|uniref:cell wall-active antibiotics response protein n=1 Tax=Undibacterium sp. Jales W-56 TaxID=2897325 RepID=UPI0021CF7043|nr:cell wall-active antibiotics response protein [Undibacterium sp. Jales W-56]MCU6434381.1 cell wall-active antibiotics response protein [Undibacterium sp. Jales W-56]
MNHSHNQRRVLFGAIVVIFGVLALVDNLHWFNARDYLQFWPMVFIAFGGLKMAQTRHGSGYIIGGALVAAGVLMTLSNMGIVYFRMRDWWPMFIIMAGLAVVFKGVRREKENASKSPGLSGMSAMADTTIDAVAFMSGNNMSVVSQDFRGGEATAVMGGIEIDLRQASIQSEAVLQVFAMWGGIVLKVPADWTVVSNGIPIMGGIDDKTVPPMAPVKRLVIEGYVIMGGVEIKN